MDERVFLAEALDVACRRMGLTRDDDQATYSTYADSIGARVRQGDSVRWLRVYPQWDTEAERQGWAASAAIPGVSKPMWYGCHDFEHKRKAMRADLLSIAPSPAVTSELILTESPVLNAMWFVDLRQSVEALAAWPTGRGSEERFARSLDYYMGVSPGSVERFVTSHTDMFWCNVTAPEFCLLDWDCWGLAPLGYGPAKLYCSALLVPDVAAEVYKTFRDQLDTDDGRISLVLAASLLLEKAEARYPEIIEPVQDLLRRLA
jgi:hypothetical protein